MNTNAPGFVCDRCSQCCRTHRVPLTSHDITRLLPRASELGVAAEDFIDIAGPEKLDMTGEPESFFRLREGRRMLFLAHRELGGGGCVFLGDGGCSVHDARPFACRAYPYELPNHEALRLDVHAAVACPEETGVNITKSRPPNEDRLAGQYQQAVMQRNLEASEHASWVSKWNARQSVRLRMGKLPEDRAALLHRLLSANSSRFT